VAALVTLGVIASTASASTPAAYRASLNAMCRADTLKLHALEAKLRRAEQTGNHAAYAVLLGQYLGLGLRQDAVIETTPVPRKLRRLMGRAISLLKQADNEVRAILTDIASGYQTALQIDLHRLIALNGPINRRLDAAGLRDCGSHQS
jgi:hypothetical protein